MGKFQEVKADSSIIPQGATIFRVHIEYDIIHSSVGDLLVWLETDNSEKEEFLWNRQGDHR